ncbi:MAG: NUDIX hydrolase [Rickettsiales bacterium]|jgi:8-oxo-dGTP pyrophosphatase MutT (NUDIX family)|nr:NUDIX hydrolase [Rickettsiales bacterium]
MHRNNLLELLEKYIPSSEEESKAKEDIIIFVNENHNCFERELEKGHITGSSWLLNKEGDKALLMHHRKLNRWFQPGGHADGDSDILAVAIKEAQEESGINAIEAVDGNIFDIDIHLIPENKKENAHYHYDIRFLLQVKSDEELSNNGEAKELRWVNRSDVISLTKEESVVRMVRKWM